MKNPTNDNNVKPDHIAGPYIGIFIPCISHESICRQRNTFKQDYLSEITNGSLTENKILNLIPFSGKSLDIDSIISNEFEGISDRFESIFLNPDYGEIFPENLDQIIDSRKNNRFSLDQTWWVAYLFLIFESDKSSSVTFHFGYQDYMQIWLNQQSIYLSKKQYTGNDLKNPEEMSNSIRKSIRKGKNVLLAKISWLYFGSFYFGMNETDAKIRIAYQIRDGRIYAENSVTQWASLKQK